MLGDTAIREAGLEDLAAAVAAGRRLGDDQVARLWRCPHLHAVRELGDRMRRRLHPERPAAPAPGVTPLGVEPASPEALCALRDRGLCAVVLCDPDRRRTALEMLHALACARLILDDVPHVWVSAAALGEKLGPVALGFGADQIQDGAPPREVAA